MPPRSTYLQKYKNKSNSPYLKSCLFIIHLILKTIRNSAFDPENLQKIFSCFLLTFIFNLIFPKLLFEVKEILLDSFRFEYRIYT